MAASDPICLVDHRGGPCPGYAGSSVAYELDRPSREVTKLRQECAELRLKLRASDAALIAATARAEASENAHRTLSIFAGDAIRKASR